MLVSNSAMVQHLGTAVMSGGNTSGFQNATVQIMTSCVNATQADVDQQTRASNDALLYIVTVLLFYSASMVILMVKYIRRERAEAEMAHYYSEFVLREKFKSPKLEIQNYMSLLKCKQDYIDERTRKNAKEDELAICNEDAPGSHDSKDKVAVT